MVVALTRCLGHLVGCGAWRRAVIKLGLYFNYYVFYIFLFFTAYQKISRGIPSLNPIKLDRVGRGYRPLLVELLHDESQQKSMIFFYTKPKTLITIGKVFWPTFLLPF